MPLKVSEVIRLLEADGWVLHRTRGTDAWSPDLPGCVAVADEQDECLALMREALEFHLEGLRADGDPLPRPSTVAATTVTTSAA